jgi:hypothetical protein
MLALLVGIDPGHKPTIFWAARDKNDRRDKDYLYPGLDIPSQTNLFLSSYHPLSLLRHISVLRRL